MKKTKRTSSAPVPPEPQPILKPLALSLRLNQMLIAQLQRALHHSDAVEALSILPFIQRACELRNDVNRFHDAIKERTSNLP